MYMYVRVSMFLCFNDFTNLFWKGFYRDIFCFIFHVITILYIDITKITNTNLAWKP